MNKESVNIKSFIAGEELGHIAAMTAEALDVRVSTLSLVKTMAHVVETESDEEAADYCVGAMLAYCDGMKRTAEKAEKLMPDAPEDEDTPDETDEDESEDNPLDGLFGGLLAALGELCDVLGEDESDNEDEG